MLLLANVVVRQRRFTFVTLTKLGMWKAILVFIMPLITLRSGKSANIFKSRPSNDITFGDNSSSRQIRNSLRVLRGLRKIKDDGFGCLIKLLHVSVGCDMVRLCFVSLFFGDGTRNVYWNCLTLALRCKAGEVYEPPAHQQFK